MCPLERKKRCGPCKSDFVVKVAGFLFSQSGHSLPMSSSMAKTHQAWASSLALSTQESFPNPPSPPPHPPS